MTTSRPPITTVTKWKSNAEMIEDCFRLRYLGHDDWVLDPTYGKGIWWKNIQPRHFVSHDIKIDGVDYRDLPYENEQFKYVAFDPSYVSVGGRSTTTIKEFYERYGMGTAPTSPAGVQYDIDSGVSECARVLKKGGFLLVKTMNYVSSGHMWPGVFKTYNHAIECGLKFQDELIFLGEPRTQPKRKRKDGKKVRQQHSRSNCSSLLVFQKRKR